MSKIISIHSFRGGTGKSNTTANISAILASQGLRVGVIDTDIQSPGIHVLFGFSEDEMKYSLNDYLWGKCNIEDAAYEVTRSLGGNISGSIYLIPSSIKAGEIARVLREGYDVGLLNDGFHELVEALDLDVLMIDTHPGLNEETLLSVAISDALAVIMRPDQQDYQGTSVTVEVARKLNVPRLVIVVNKTPLVYDFEQVRSQVEQLYSAEVAAVMPHSDEMMALASAGVFVLRYPDHEMTRLYRQIAQKLMS
ncbi:MAG: MinD/ParA family protein [Anaerolineales bacterium]|nr:MinD/ParA family protein [Anaerolineales bacterium]